MGNKITGKYTTIYDLPKILSDSLNNAEDTTLMAKVRPIKLNTDEEMIYRDYYDKMERRKKQEKAAEEEKKTDFVKDVLWDRPYLQSPLHGIFTEKGSGLQV